MTRNAKRHAPNNLHAPGCYRIPITRKLRLGKSYTTKQVEVVAAHEGADWIVITAIARYF